MEKELKFLKIYSGVMTIAILVLSFYVIKQTNKKDFKELNVERINVVEDNGDLKLVISNSKRQHSGCLDGVTMPKRNRPAGLIFFNSEGDEVGGLGYDVKDKYAHFNFGADQYKNDQIMLLQYNEDTEKHLRQYGLQINGFGSEVTFKEKYEIFGNIQKLDGKERRAALQKMREEGLVPEERMFVGRQWNKDVGLFINDQQGRPRIKIYIDNENNPKIELLNESGEVISEKHK